MNDETTIPEPVSPFEQLNALLDSIEQHPDAALRESVRSLVFSVIELHHDALQRLLEITAQHYAGEDLLQQFSSDEIISAVLMVHELMPQDIATRVQKALEHAREHLQDYGAEVELIGIKAGVARLRLIGSAASASVSTAMLKGVIEQSLHELAPDLLNVEYDDLIAAAQPPRLVQIAPGPAPPSQAKMIPVMRADDVPENSLRVLEIGDLNLLIGRVAGAFYACRNACPHRGLSLEKSLLEGAVLTCPWHGYQFDLRQGGRCLNDPALRLNSLPLTVENEIIKVAL